MIIYKNIANFVGPVPQVVLRGDHHNIALNHIKSIKQKKIISLIINLVFDRSFFIFMKINKMAALDSLFPDLRAKNISKLLKKNRNLYQK